MMRILSMFVGELHLKNYKNKVKKKCGSARNLVRGAFFVKSAISSFLQKNRVDECIGESVGI